MATLLGTVLDYAALGWMIFPCAPSAKTPACKRGFKEATTNPATLRRWFGSSQLYNVAIATGLASGIWALDVDGAIGAAALGDLEAKHGVLPATRTSLTGGGCHLWFRQTGELQSSTGRIGQGLDVRADGGYVLAPPSRHPEGPIYRWSNLASPAAAPDWLIRLAKHGAAPSEKISVRAKSFSRAQVGARSHYALTALDREISELANTPPGQRNHALNRASFVLHQLVAGGELDRAEVHDALVGAATANGLMADGPRSVMATIASGARAGMQHPRNRWGRM
jgi:hypothetical protein